ncbi:hypothetical protein AQBE111736_13770 [Aquirufa beregesia]
MIKSCLKLLTKFPNSSTACRETTILRPALTTFLSDVMMKLVGAPAVTLNALVSPVLPVTLLLDNPLPVANKTTPVSLLL